MWRTLLLLTAATTAPTSRAWRNVTPHVCEADFCDLLFPALDYSPFVGYAFYVRVRLFLEASASTSEEVALKLRGAELSKEHGAAPAPGALPLGAFAIFLLKSATRFDASVRYVGDAQVGVARLPPPEASCKGGLRCLESVQLRQDLFEADTSKFTAYDARYWRRVVARHVDDLGARDLRLHVHLLKDDALDAHYYVNPLVQGAPLSELRLVDVADVDNVVLGPQAALRSLTISGVDVHRYDGEELRTPGRPPRLSSRGDVTWFFAGLLEGAPNLRSLTLSRVGMTTPPSRLLTTLTRLEMLDLSGNAGLDVDAVVAAVSSDVTSLSIADCLLGDAAALTALLRRFPRLRRLDAGGCSLRTLPPFDGLASLRHLDLSRNRLSDVPDDAFSSLTALRSLNLSHNAVTQLHLLLPGVVTLDTLDLSHNAVAHPAALLRSGAVATLNLSGNPVAAWDDADAFSTWARRVDLSRCHVAFLTAPMRASLETLDAVVLDGNPLDCEHCRVEELRSWLRARTVSSGVDAPQCERPAALKGVPVVDSAGVGVCTAEGVNVYAVVLPLVVVLGLVGAAVASVVYVYRYEITYIKHLVKLRSRRKANSGAGVFQYDAFVCYR